MIPIDKEQVRLLEQRLRGAGVDRRTFLKIAGAAMAAPAAGSLLAACGGEDEEPGEAAVEATSTLGPVTGTPEDGGPTPPSGAVAEATVTSIAEASPEVVATSEATQEGATEEMDAEQILHDIANRQDPASHDFNADLYCDGAATIWMGLLTYDQDFNPIPGWAESWEPNEDATMWTFHIRPNNTGFNNGDPVTAETFVYSWQRMLKPETNAPYAAIIYDIKNAKEINQDGADPSTLGARAVDDWTLEVDMVGPRGLFPVIVGYVACVPTHPPSAERGGNFTDPAEVGGPVVSNGPWQLVEWAHERYCTLTKNPNYWNADNIKLETVDWMIVPAEQGMLPYEAGEADYALVPGADLPRVQSDPQMSQELQKWVEPLIWKILPQVTKAPFDDINARRALQHSIDRERINELTNGGGDPAYCLMPPGLLGYFGEEFKEYCDFDPAQAQEFLAQSAYAGGNWPATTMILRNEAHLNSNIMAEDIAAQLLENLGLEVQLQVMDLQAFRELQFSLEPQMIFIRWFYDYPDPNNGYFDMFYSQKESGRRQAWSNEQFDQLTIQGKEAVAPEDRLEIYRQCEQIMQEEVAYIPVVYRNAYYVYKPWVKGVPVNKQGFMVPNGNIYLGMYDTVYISGRESA